MESVKFFDKAMLDNITRASLSTYSKGELIGYVIELLNACGSCEAKLFKISLSLDVDVSSDIKLALIKTILEMKL